MANLADRVAVMYGGSIVETAGARRLFDAPAHPYTRGLLASLPAIGDEDRGRLTAIPGQPPDMTRLPEGCAFVERCPYAFARCRWERPPLLPAGKKARAACWWTG